MPSSPPTTTRCALAPVLPRGQTLSERLLAGGRRRRRSRGRVRAWRSSRERVADASPRHLAISPPSLIAVAAFIHAPLDVLTNQYSLSSRSALFCLCTSYLYFVLYASLLLCVAARIFAFLSHYSRVRRAAAPSVIVAFLCVERLAPHLRRVATLSFHASLSLRT